MLRVLLFIGFFVRCLAAIAADSQVLPAMVVTGSHLPPEVAPAMPVVTINADQIRNSGLRSVGELLQSLPIAAGAPLSTGVGARDSGGGLSRGVETVELRGLGAERTLVLINGRRMVAGGNGTAGLVDLGSIPLGMIERVEILKNGASVEYGADAVAGVVNLITRTDVAHREIRFSTAQTERGDGEAVRAGVNAGTEFETALGVSRWIGGLEWFDQRPVSKADRAFSRDQLNVDGAENAVIVGPVSSATPQGNFRTSDGRLTLIDGRDGTSPDDFRPFIGDGPDSDRYNFNPFEDLVQPSRRLSGFVMGEQEWGATRLRVEGLLQQRDSRTQLAPLPFFTNRLADVVVASDNAYNPFGEDLSDVRRRLVEAGPRSFSQDNRLWRLAMSLDGQLAGGAWDVHLSHGRNAVTQQQSGDFRADRVRLALGPSFAEQGAFRCGSPEVIVEGCVPLNLFGGAGSITPEMLTYLSGRTLVDRFRNEQTVAGAGWRVGLFDLPAGRLTAAVGIEFREERAADTPDAETQAANTTGSAREATRGSYQARDVYLEIGAPLVRDRPGLHDLSIEGGVRFVDYSNFSTHEVFDAGLRYSPAPDWTFRVAYAGSFRAPTVAELFGGQTQANPAVDDPCADFTTLSSMQIDRCVAQGVPADGTFDQTGNETPQIGGGNRDLRPETAETFSAGLIWSPQDFPGFVAKLDYYDIRIDDGIAALGATTILAQCLQSGDPRFCERISRDDSGEIIEVRGQKENLATDSARGLDLELAWRRRSGIGRIAASLLLSRVLERALVAAPGTEPFAGVGRFDPDNFGAIPRWKGAGVLDWRMGDLEAGYTLNWVGSMRESGGDLSAGTSRRIGSALYHDLRIGWRLSSDVRAGLVIANLADRQPPFVANGDLANTDVRTYRLLGRTIRAQLRYTF